MKWILGFLAAVLLVLGVGVFYLDSIAETAIERGGTYALGVETRVGSVSLGLLSGKFGVGDLSVANPPGYDRPHFLSFRNVELSAGIRQLLTEEPLVVDRIALSGIGMSLESKGRKTNYDTILENLGDVESGTSGEEAPAEGSGAVIRELLIQDVQVHIALSTGGAKLTELDVNVPEIRLTNLGSGGDAVQTQELFGIVTKAILEAVAKRRDILPAELVGDLRGRLRGLERVPIELPAGLGDSQDKLLDSATEKAREGLKGLFRRGD